MTRVSNRELWTALSLYGDPAKAGATEPKARRKQGSPEQDVLNAVIAALRLHPKVAWCVRMNSGAYKTPDGRFVRFGFPGCPDILGQLKDGRILMIECKSEKGHLTYEQRSMLQKVSYHHGVAGVARSVDDALAIVEETHRREL